MAFVPVWAMRPHNSMHCQYFRQTRSSPVPAYLSQGIQVSTNDKMHTYTVVGKMTEHTFITMTSFKGSLKRQILQYVVCARALIYPEYGAKGHNLYRIWDLMRLHWVPGPEFLGNWRSTIQRPLPPSSGARREEEHIAMHAGVLQFPMCQLPAHDANVV